MSLLHSIFRVVVCLVAIVVMVQVGHAQAQIPKVSVVATAENPRGDAVVRVEPYVSDGVFYVDVDSHIELTPELRNAAEKGVPLFFTADLVIVSKRWWWFDKEVVNQQQTWKIVYNALTRQWRVGSGDLSLPESSLNDAMAPIRSIRGWAVSEASVFDFDASYEGRIRVRLDSSLLARPFQVNALNSAAWSLSTPWKAFTFSISLSEPAQ